MSSTTDGYKKPWLSKRIGSRCLRVRTFYYICAAFVLLMIATIFLQEDLSARLIARRPGQFFIKEFTERLNVSQTANTFAKRTGTILRDLQAVSGVRLFVSNIISTVFGTKHDSSASRPTTSENTERKHKNNNTIVDNPENKPADIDSMSQSSHSKKKSEIDSSENISVTLKWPINYKGKEPAQDLLVKIYQNMFKLDPPLFNTTSEIPKIIHQMWISESIPVATKPWVEKWKDTNPDWTYMFWTDKSARDFIVKYYKPLLEIYDSYALPVQKADMFRYIVLFAFGGVYADLDIEPLKSLNPIRDWSPCILSREPEAHHQVASWILFGSRKELNYTLACNAFMACRPGHPYLFFLISRLVERSPNVSKKPCPLGTTLWCTGPYILTETAFFYKSALGDLVVTYPKDDVFIASSVDFMPTFSSKQVNEMKKHCNKLDKMPKLGVEICKILQKRNFTNFEPNINESHTVHHWFGSYHQNKGQLNEKIYVNDLMPKAMNFSQMEPYFNITYPSAETTPILNDWPTTHEWPIRHWGDSPAQELRMKIYETMHEVSPTVFNMSRKIPQIIHQTWISSSIPVVTKPWIAKWKDTNPDWTYMFWTDKSARDFIVKYYRPLLEIYDSYTVPVQKADMFRYIVLFAFGGVYADLDIEPLKSLNPIRDWSPCILSREPEAHHQVANWIYYGSKVELNYTLASNAFMACRPGHPYLFYLISYLAKQSPKVSEKECAFYRTIWCTGPVVVTQSAAFYKRALLNLTDTYPNDDIFIAKSVDFLPTFDPSQVEQMKTNCNRPDKMPQLGVETCKILQQRNFSNFETDDMKSYTVHHYLGSFYKKKEELHLDQTINVKDIVPNVTQLHELEPYFNKTNL